MYLHHAYNGVYDAMMCTVNASVCSFVKYIVDVLAWLFIDKMSVSTSVCLFVCEEYACIVATTKVVPVPSLQLSTVVLPPMLLQMVNEVALVEPLGQQWPTAVTEGTP